MRNANDAMLDPMIWDRWVASDMEWVVTMVKPDQKFEMEVTITSKDTGKVKSWFAGYFRRWCSGAEFLGGTE